MTSIIAGIGGSPVVSSASGGKVTPINTLNTTPASVVGINPSRMSITFHNPGTVDVYVYMLVTATGAAAAPSLSSLGGCFKVFAGGLLVITGECQGAWGAFSASLTNQPLTVMESNL